MARIKYQEALGLEVKRERPPIGPAPSKPDLVKLYIKYRHVRLGVTNEPLQE